MLSQMSSWLIYCGIDQDTEMKYASIEWLICK